MELLRQSLLTLLIFLPAAGAVAVLLPPCRRFARGIALGVTCVNLALAMLLLIPAVFDSSRAGDYAPGGVVQLVLRTPWVPSFHVEYFVGVDGLSMPLVLLSALVFVLSVAASWNTIKQPAAYFSLVLLLQTGVLGSFLALDLLLFFVFFEMSLLPMYFLIGIWGGERKEYAAIKFFLYTFLGSIAILVGIIGVYLACGSFDLLALPHLLRGAALTDAARTTLFLLLLVGFLVKLPAVPLHTWLPDAHVEAPTPVSMLLAAVLLKLGGYGLLRVAMPLFAEQATALWWLTGGLGVLSILYGALCALGQRDFKRLVAYSSVSHMGMVLLGAAMMTSGAISGAIFMMVSHGLTSAAMFFIVGIIYDRLHHRDLDRLGGLITPMPGYARWAGLFMFASLGLPGLSGFVGEILVLLGTFAARSTGPVAALAPTWAIYSLGGLAAFGIVLTAGYMLFALQRLLLGAPVAGRDELIDVTPRESAVLWPLGVLTVLLGILPWPTVLAYSDRTVGALLKVMS
jgi:NADH-quinone oxidoreductase subunit M